MKLKTFLIRSIIFVFFFFLLDFGLSKVLLNGLFNYYGFNIKPEILINGSSMAGAGFNKSALEKSTNYHVSKYAREGVNVSDRHAMMKFYFSEYPGKVNTVIYEINPLIFSTTSTADNTYTLFLPFMDNKNIDSYIKDHADNKEYYINKLIRCKRFDPLLLKLVIKGYSGFYENLKTNVIDTTVIEKSDNLKEKKPIIMAQNNIRIFEETMRLIKSNNARIILVMMPMYYRKNQEFDSLGFLKLISYFEHLDQIDSNIEFLNLNQGELTTNSEYYSDLLHVNVYGQEKITSALIKRLTVNQ